MSKEQEIREWIKKGQELLQEIEQGYDQELTLIDWKRVIDEKIPVLFGDDREILRVKLEAVEKGLELDRIRYLEKVLPDHHQPFIYQNMSWKCCAIPKIYGHQQAMFGKAPKVMPNLPFLVKARNPECNFVVETIDGFNSLRWEHTGEPGDIMYIFEFQGE